MTKVTKDSFSTPFIIIPTSSNKWTSIIVTNYLKCSWSVTLWYDRHDTRKLIFISQCRSNTRLNANDVTRMTRAALRARAKIPPTFWEHFCTPLGCVLVETFIRCSKSKCKTSPQALINLFLSAMHSFLRRVFSLSLCCFHIQTHSYSGGVIECDNKSCEGCWRVIRLTCEMEPTWHQQAGSDTYSRHGWINPAKTRG